MMYGLSRLPQMTGVWLTAAGLAGVLGVLLAGWTTANPTLYRAGLALQSVTPGWARWKTTLAAGTCPDDELAIARDEGRVPDFNASDIRDGVRRSRCSMERNAQVARARF
jgi:hypothetical protein